MGNITGSIFLRIHQFLPRSQVNGPGIRSVIWLQGCSLACKGCFNPETHSFQKGAFISIEDLLNQIRMIKDIEGITISGGEPLQQRQSLVPFLKELKQRMNLSVVLFSGYSWVEIQNMPEANEILTNIDVLIAGRYIESLRIAKDLKGSSNKTVHFLTSRYSLTDFVNIPASEIIITPEGKIFMSGIEPLQLNH